MRKTSLIIIMLALLVGMMASPTAAQDDSQSIKDIVESRASAAENADFTILLQALDAARFTRLLDESGPFTVFAPTDEAFTAALESLNLSAEDLLADEELLVSTLLYHIVPGNFSAENLSTRSGESLSTAFWGAELSISADGDSLRVGDAQVLTANISARNGVIHVIDSVLLPPTNDPGSLIGGVIEGEMGITDLAVERSASAGLTTLVEAINAAALTETLNSAGPITVFAPTDEAFATFLDSIALTAEELLNDPEALDIVLRYHVVPYGYFAADLLLLDGASMGTLLPNTSLSISVDGEIVMVNDATVQSADITANNGIVHVIDTVLVPQELLAPEDDPEGEAENAPPEAVPSENATEAPSELPSESPTETPTESSTE